ncbi:16S rRNA (cytosine(1402)-N(4))-methyltransferase [hydrothermal vent metagenome]|uniref:16S rRNA (Cytosine(1402)-N(4))-methyltransferase n=1 Tax=hydrothermal vent metagenome TaxID=652676 RepID=A0A3B1DJA9_9ZZZZ
MTNNENDEPIKHKRRVRYKGSHPKHFKEKYKEHNSQKYPEDVEKIIQSGKTPVGSHRPICVTEILDILKPSPGEVGLDATLGFGGHSVELLKKIIPGGRLFAMDVDPVELARTEKRLRAMGFSDKELFIERSNFAGMAKLLVEVVSGFDFILADLGISSMQLDNPERGFTFKREGPLDLRLNPQRGQSASQLIKSLDAKQLEIMFYENSDEPYSRLIAQAVFNNRDEINKTTDLANVIADALSQESFSDCNTATTTSIRRVFQALRIEVNAEFYVLEQFLMNLPLCLKSKGRVAILSFHSGEDNRVREFFKKGIEDGVYSDISPEALRSSVGEQYSNPRSKCAMLRWAVKK